MFCDTFSVIGHWLFNERRKKRRAYIYKLEINIYSKNHIFFLKRNSSFDNNITMNDDYYLPHGPLHEHNRMISETASSSSDYLSYSLPEFHTEKTPKKNNGRFKQQHHRARTSSTKTKSQITEKEAKEAIIRGLVTETNDIDITKLSGKDKYFILNYFHKYIIRYINIISTRSTIWC